MSDLDISQDTEPTDDFATVSDVPIQPTSTRVSPNKIPSGVTRGTQTYINLDGSYMTLGLVPDGSGRFGIAFFDPTNTLITATTGLTQYVYDKTTGKNILQIGKLPDGTYGLIVAKAGFNVADAFK